MRRFLSKDAAEDRYPLEDEDKRRMFAADFVRWEIPDLNGVSKGKTMTRSAVASSDIGGVSLYGGVLGFGANSDLVLMPGVGDAGHPDCFAVPRAKEAGVTGSLPTAVPLPWVGGDKRKVVSVICDTKWKHGGNDNWQGACPRAIARRQLQRLASKGLSLKSACEYEFRVFDNETREPIAKSTDIFNTLAVAEHEEHLFEIEEAMRAMGIAMETIQMEYGSAQFEMTLAPLQGLDAADAAFRFRHCVKELFQRKGMLASFMTKPIEMETANSCHYNHSLQSLNGADGKLVYSEGKLNDLGRHWLGGLMKHAPALTALYAPTVNCYRRLHQPWAPSHANWGLENRAMMVRLKAESNGGCYFEGRLGCGASNPYLVLAATVAAGLDGLENKLEPPAPDTTEDCTKLPETLPEAIMALEADEYMAKELGAEFVEWFGILKKAEIEAASGGLQKERDAYMRFL